MTPYLTHYQIHYLNSLMKYGQKYNPWKKTGVFQKSPFEFLKRFASTLNTTALQLQKGSVHKINRQEVEGFTHPFKIYKLC